VAHIAVKTLDAQGRMHPDADHEVKFEVQGPGKLIGLDNGDPSSTEDYKGKKRKCFHGMCLAIVQSTGGTGEIRLTATAPGLKPAVVTFAAKA
jgi:beta-galactosidase